MHHKVCIPLGRLLLYCRFAEVSASRDGEWRVALLPTLLLALTDAAPSVAALGLELVSGLADIAPGSSSRSDVRPPSASGVIWIMPQCEKSC